MVGMPVPYVDATSSYAFPSKWARALVAAAGLLTYGPRASAGLGPTLGLAVLPNLPGFLVKVGALPATAVPPLLFTTCLTSVRLGASSSLVMVQVADCPRPRVTLLPFCVPPTQLQAEAV